MGFLELRRPWGFSPEARRGSQGASRAAPGKSGLHARGEGERVLALVHALEKEMATHSSVLAWRIPGMAEPGGCRLWGCTELDTTEVTWQHEGALTPPCAFLPLKSQLPASLCPKWQYVVIQFL